MSKRLFSRSFRKNQLDLSQPYHQMNSIEKRIYRRDLARTQTWDGAIVIENCIQNGTLSIGNPKRNKP